MKQCKHFLLTIVALLCSIVVKAHDLEVNGIYYNITSETDLTAEVTCKGDYHYNYDDEYFGSITLPATVTYNGVEYSVTSIGEYAFCGCDRLTSITIPEGVTSIEDGAFCGCGSLASITLPEGVTSIGERAFSACNWLTSITIPEGVTSIGDYAFHECIGLTSIIFPESMISIGDWAFWGCSSLATITLPEGVTAIGRYAFRDCSSLTSIAIPENSQLKSIGDYAFDYCSSLTAITLPLGVTSIGERVFERCFSLIEIVVAEGNEVYDSRNGCNAIIETNSNTLLQGCSATVIPEDVTSIAWRAFCDCKDLTSVNIPKGVTHIAAEAFRNCNNLINIVVDEGNTVYDSRNNCNAIIETRNNRLIQGCFTTIIPEGVTSIGEYAFSDCRSLAAITIPKSVTSIGKYAFYNCRSLTTITLPEGVTRIEKETFAGCVSLTTITIPEGVTAIGRDAFSGCSSLTSITIPESVTSIIGSYTFYSCSSLTAITCKATTPPTIETLSTFYKVDKSIPVYVPAESVDAYKAAKYWKEFTNINGVVASGTCGDNLTWKLTEEYELVIEGTGDMYDYSPETTPWYEYRESIQTITLPEGVTSIGDYVFADCTNLTSITIPEGVTSIGDWAFENCSSLTAITVAEGNAIYDSRGGCNAIIETNSNTLIVGCSATIIPEGVTCIGEGAFWGCTSLTNISIPESVTSIGNKAFQYCSSLTNINIPESVTSIGNDAFYCCSSLTTITIPEGVKSIGFRAFFFCTSLTTITISEGVKSIGSNAFQYCSSLTAVTIPESVKSIGTWIFSYCSSLTDITIPEGVTSIGYAAFSDCSSLTTITCEAATPPTIDDSSTFDGVDKSIPVYVPAGSVEAYKTAAYWGEFTNIQPILIASGTCGDNLTWKLTEEYELVIEGTGEMYDYTQGGTPWSEYRDAILTITLPEGMTRIGHWAFSDCTSITTITVPASVTSIGYGILMGCTNLTSIAVEEGNTVYDSRNGCNAIIKTSNNTLVSGCSATIIPEGVTGIGNRAFGYCTFTTIDIPEGVTSIGDYAFGYCGSLTTITLPESMTTIGTGAFVGCRKLAELTSLATTPPALGSNTTFGNVNKSIPVYVPAASVEAYKSAEHWSEFTNYQTIEEPAPEAVTITISKYGSGTYSSAYALDFTDVKGLKAYVATGYNHLTGEVTLLRVHTAEAGMGLLVKGTPGVSYEVPILESTADHTLNMLVATLEKTKVNGHSDDGVYANYKYTVDPAQNPDEPLFYPFVDNSHLSAGKAYLQIPVAWLPDTGQKSIRYRFDEGETTDIEDEEIINHKSGIIYDLMGRRVLSPKKGEIYIINNQKIVY